MRPKPFVRLVRPLPMDEVCFASFGDASFASAKTTQCPTRAFHNGLYPRNGQNEMTEFSPTARHSKQIGRVVRSTLSAEAYAMSSSLDKLTWIRCMRGYIKRPDSAWHKPEAALQEEHPGLMITDCKSLYDLITKNATPNCQEWRATIEFMLFKKQSKGHTCADGSQQPSCWQTASQRAWTQRFSELYFTWGNLGSMTNIIHSDKTQMRNLG